MSLVNFEFIGTLFSGFHFKDKRIGCCGVLRKSKNYIAQERLKVNKDSLRNAFVEVPEKKKLTPVEVSQGKSVGSKFTPGLTGGKNLSLPAKQSVASAKLNKALCPPQTKRVDKNNLNVLFNNLPSNVPVVSPNNPKQQGRSPSTKQSRPVRL